MTKKKEHTSQSKDVGVERKKTTPRCSKKSFKEVADITFKRHERSFEKLVD